MKTQVKKITIGPFGKWTGNKNEILYNGPCKRYQKITKTIKTPKISAKIKENNRYMD